LSPDFVCLLAPSGTGGWAMGIAVSSSHIVSATPSFSPSVPAPAWGPSYRRQSSTNCSNVSTSHGLQFIKCSSVGPFNKVPYFRNRLLQCGSPTGSQVLPANLLQHVLLSPLVKSCQEPAPTQAVHGVTAFFRHPPATEWGLPRDAGGDLLHRGPP